jgi:hypothetical protein
MSFGKMSELLYYTLFDSAAYYAAEILQRKIASYRPKQARGNVITAYLFSDLAPYF